MLAQFLVVSSETNEAAGHVVCYDAEANSGHAHIGAIFDPDYMHAGIAVDAVTVFVRYLFATYSLRKLYLDVRGFNYELISSGAGRFFQVEGKLRDHDYYNGQYWDKYILAIYRGDPMGAVRS